MSLPKNEETESTSNPPYLTLNDLWEQMLTMRQDSAQTAEDKFQVALLLATVNKLRTEQETFMSKVESKLNLIDSSQLRTISLQEQYKKDIGTDAKKLLNTLYFAIREEQDKILNENLQKNTAAYEQMSAQAKSCAEQINKAAAHAENATSHLFRITSAADLMYYITPALVLIDLVIRVIQRFF